MIALHSIKIKQFRAYEDVEVNFRRENGIVLMSGDNGAGKSTFINAICWCLYGDTPFNAGEEEKEVLNKYASDDTETSVEIIATLKDGKTYSFTRKAHHRGSYGGVLTVAYEENDNWDTISSVSAQDAVRRFLPKDIRHLFFFNGEQIKNIFDPRNGGDLRRSVHIISEVNVVEEAQEHLRQAQREYLKEISARSRYTKEIDDVNDIIFRLEHEIKNAEETISVHEKNITLLNYQIDELDKKIQNSSAARELLEQRDMLETQIQELKESIDIDEDDKKDKFRNSYAKALMSGLFGSYKNVLVEARDNKQIPSPVDPAVTANILEQGVCICGRTISDHERHFIEEQHRDYVAKQELQFLTDGILTYQYAEASLIDSKYMLQDIIETINNKTLKLGELQVRLKEVNNSLEDKDSEITHDNPEQRRNDIRDQLSVRDRALGLAHADLRQKKKELEEKNTALRSITAKDARTEDLERRRSYVEDLIQRLGDIKDAMEQSILNKLEKSVTETFTTILPASEFGQIHIDSNYTLTLSSKDDTIFRTSNLSTGQLKTLGLSLVYGLSKYLGYSDMPLLIDNLYGDIKEDRYQDISDVIGALSKNKQIVIMDLNADKTLPMLARSNLSQEFHIIRNENSGDSRIRTEIKETSI